MNCILTTLLFVNGAAALLRSGDIHCKLPQMGAPRGIDFKSHSSLNTRTYSGGTEPKLTAGVVIKHAGVAMASTAVMGAHAAVAAEEASTTAAALPNDGFIVGIALVLLVLIGALQFSLGDVVSDEANLPSSTSRINQLRKQRSTFIRGGSNRGRSE
eukprot:6206747-Pleurochrysis_carterae.AAC.10